MYHLELVKYVLQSLCPGRGNFAKMCPTRIGATTLRNTVSRKEEFADMHSLESAECPLSGGNDSGVFCQF